MSEDRLKILLEVGLGSGIGELQKLETSLKNLDTYSTSAQAGLKKITDVDFGRLSSQIDSVAGGMQKIGTAMSLIGVPMGLIAKESINMYADLESQIQRNTALLGGGKAEYEQILALSKELGASSPFDALEIGAGIEALAAAGYSLQDIQAAMPTVTEMAVATGEDLNSMSEILIATLNSYGESADMAGVYGDKLATIANISSASITDFGESMKYVGGIADAFGVDIDELGAVIGALADVNIKGSMAGTGLRTIITDLANPTGKIEEIFASFGLTMDDLNPKVVDFVEILQKMKDAGVSDEALMAAFGDRGGVVAVNMLSQLDKVKANYETLQNDSVGMLKKFSAQMRDTLKFVMDEMGGTIANIMIEIGEGLKPIVQEMGAWLNENQGTLVEFAKNAVEGLTPFVEKFMDLSKKLMDWFNSLPKDLQSKIAGLTGLGGAMATIGGPLLLLGSLPVSGTAKIAGALKELASYMGKLVVPTTVAGDITAIGTAASTAAGAGGVGALTTALAALGGPVVLGAIAGIGIGLAAYTTNFGDFRDNVNSVISELGQAAQNISSGDYVAAGRDCAEAFGKGFETVSDLITKGIPDASRIFYEFNVGLMDATTGMTRGLGQATGGFIREMSSDISKAISDLQPSLPELVIPTKIDPPNKAEYEANMKEFLDGIKSVIDNYDLSDSSTRFVTKAAVNSVTMGMGGNSIELVHQIGTFFKGIYEEGIIHAVDEFIAANPRMSLDKVEEHFKNSMNASDFNVASEYIGKMKTEMQTAFQGLEKEIATPLRNAGVSVKEFATQSAADIHNAMEKWQESFKESKLSYEEWMDSLKKSGQFDEYIADMQKYAETFPEITKEAGSAAQVIQGLDFMPVEFKAGNSIYANYKNNVLTPIVSEPIQIMLENATESEFNYILTHYNEIKNQIENSPINITYVGPAGDPEPNWGVTPHYTPDIQPNPNNATLNVNVVSMPQSFTDKYKEFDKESQLKMWNALPPDAQSKFGGSTQSTPDNKTVNQNTNALNTNAQETRDLSKNVSQLYRDYPDWDSYQNMYQLQHKGASPDLAYQAYTQDQRHAGNSPDSASIGWKPGDPDPRAKPYNNVSSSNKSLESTNKKLESTSSKLINVFDKGTSVNDALAKVIERSGGDVNKISGQKFAIGEDEYTVQRKGLSFEARGSNTSAQMKQDFIKYGEELNKLNKEKAEALNESLTKDENWIEAQRNIAKQYDDKIKSLEDRYGITVSDYRKLQTDGESGLGKFGATVQGVNKELSSLPKIAFKALENAFNPKVVGELNSTSGSASRQELAEYLWDKYYKNVTSQEDFMDLIRPWSDSQMLEAASLWGEYDTSGRKNTLPDVNSPEYAEYLKLQDQSKTLQESVNEALRDGLVTKDDAIKWLNDFGQATDTTTEQTKENILSSRNLLEIYQKADDLQTYYADAIGDGTYSVKEQTEVSERYADVLKYLKDMGIDATGALEGLPPALKGLVEAILNIINPVKTSSDSASPGSSSSNPTTQAIGKTSESSHQLFAKMQNDFKALNDQYKAGSINQSTYISKMKELSVYWDTVSRGPTIYKEALLGQDRQNAQNFIRMIKEQFRLDIGATGADGQKNYDPSGRLTKAIDEFISIKPIPPVEIPIAPIEPVKIPVELSQYPTRNPETWKGNVQGNKPAPTTKQELGDSPRRNEEVWKGLTKEIDTNSQSYPIGKSIKETGTEAKSTIPQINTLNSAFEKIGLTGSGLSDVLSNVNQSLSDHHANIQESKDYLSQYNDAAGENVKYTKSQEGQTKDLMNALGMLGTAQNMYNQYMSEGILDSTESAHVQEALAAATKMMGDAGIDANTNLSGLPGALQALASAAQAAMSQIQAAISQAQSAASAATSDWKLVNAGGKYPTMAPGSPTNFTVNMNGNTFPAGIKPGDVIKDLTGQLRIVA